VASAVVEGAKGAANSVRSPNSGVTRTTDPPDAKRARVHLFCDALGLTLTARHMEAPKVTQERAGGWELVERPKLEPLTNWTGPQALRVTLTLLIDGYEDKARPIQKQLDTLRRFAYRVPALDRPPTLVVIGAVPYSKGGLAKGSEDERPEWVIEGLEIVDEIHTASGTPSRSIATVRLLKFTPARAKVRRAKKTAATTYTWRSGDTLAEVADKKLGAASRAPLIRAANPKIKTWSKVRTGTKIKIPGVG
jgi:LysM repeat protein